MKRGYRSKFAVLALCALAVLVLSSCLPGDGANGPEKPAGFFMGFWHGVVAPISLVVQIFKPAIRAYETFNTGFWYDLGFWLAVIGGAGGSAAAAKRSKRRRDDEGES